MDLNLLPKPHSAPHSSLMHSMRRGDQLKSVSSLSSTPLFFLFSVCLHSDSLGLLIKTLFTFFSLYSPFFSLSLLPPVHPTFLSLFIFLFFRLPALCSNPSQQLSLSLSLSRQPPSVFIWASISCHSITHTAALHLSHFSLSSCTVSPRTAASLRVKFTSRPLSYICVPL